MPRAVKKSEPFNVEIYKDQSLQQLIVKMSEGVAIDVKNIDAGSFTGLTIKPDNELVQKVSNWKITFTTSH